MSALPMRSLRFHDAARDSRRRDRHGRRELCGKQCRRAVAPGARGVAGAHALGEAARLIARGDADVLVAGGTDARVSPLGMMRYHDLGWLATRDDIEPATVSAPFDAGATGFVNAEGAGILVLESLEH